MILETPATSPEFMEFPCIYVDGTQGSFQIDKDLELSHWIPNQTPPEYALDTSTACCLEFVSKNPNHKFEAVSNNHLDTDGLLSVFSILKPGMALANRTLLQEAAAMGDFGQWGDRNSALFYHFISKRILKKRSALTMQEAYESLLQDVEKALAEQSYLEDQNAIACHKTIQEVIDYLSSEQVIKRRMNDHFIMLEVQYSYTGSNSEYLPLNPQFDEGLDRKDLLPSYARNALFPQSLQWVSLEVEKGRYFHDLFLPQYSWASTPKLWRFPHLKDEGSSNTHLLDTKPWLNLVNQLNQIESGSGEWKLQDKMGPFTSINSRPFPIFLSFVHSSGNSLSTITPQEIFRKLQSIPLDF